MSRRVLIASCLVLCLAALSACGGSSGDSQGTSATVPGGGARTVEEPFRTPGGDNSILEAGRAASPAELAQAAAVLHAFLGARAAGDWQRVCLQMTPALARSIGPLLKLGPADCAKALARLSTGVPERTLRAGARVRVGALRVMGRRGFLLFHGPAGEALYIPVGRDGGGWKIAAIAPSALS